MSSVAAVTLFVSVLIIDIDNLPLVLTAGFIMGAVVGMHIKNIERLRAGTEPKTFGKKKEVA